ncbi:glycosyltransferase family 4 protein [Alkalimonas sp. MEB108]|uniref:Glycosyltransferase family 4 protein n=1 Tax=Alkalimonas cellulosilytica TaxID=3058395 RepID=A0ABU7J1M9_9GAMM|nr:glycosyltransferase family 4 protein [Alkalimonas sp. MEB108]MEE2000418.1 glycosyltransferase family 4 protein [Alkalimonas sp. MEB108]
MNAKKKLLWIKADELYPLNTGGKIRTYNMLKELKEFFDITYFTLKSDSLMPLGNMSDYSDHQVFARWKDNKKNKIKLCVDAIINCIFSNRPFVIDKYTSNEITKSLETVINNYDFDVIISDFLSLSDNLLSLEKKPGAKYIVFQHNVESYIWERHFNNASNFVARSYFKSQWQRFLSFEKNACQWFDGVIAVSKFDNDVFINEFKLKNVLGFVETGVDTQFFSMYERNPNKNNIVFLGSMDWMPNIDGIENFVRKTYPLIKKKIPDVTLTILGRNPPDKIKQLNEKDKSIHVTGTVDDVRPFLAKASVSVVPLRIGGGTRIKIFETMAAGLPVVSTTIGAEGLPVVDGEHIAIADDSEAFAEKVVEALVDVKYSDEMAKCAQNFVSNNFSWKTVTKDFVAMINQVKQ